MGRAYPSLPATSRMAQTIMGSELREHERQFVMKWRTRAFLGQCRALSISTDTPSPMLEIGCGLGVLRQMLEAATKWNVDAMDLNAGALFHSAPGRGRTALYNI